MIDRVFFSTGAAVGGAGVSTATGYSTHIAGKILAVYVAYLGSPPAGTTDFTLYVAGEEVFEPYVVHGRLEATIAQANLADYCDVTVWFET